MLALILVASACGERAAEEIDFVRIEVASEGPPRADAAASAATLWENEQASSIHLGPLKRAASPGTWDERVVRSERAGPSRGRLIFGASAAALVYHLASRATDLPSDLLQPNRLVRVDSDGTTELALWIDDTGDSGDSVAWEELDTESAARMLALAEALDAGTVLRENRFPVSADGVAQLPFFVPVPPGDWRILRDGSLESLLPPDVVRRVATEPGFRTLRDRFLAVYAASLPGLATAIGETAHELSIPGFETERTEAQTLLTETAAAVAGYLDSVWIEMLVRERRPDSARISLYVNSVTDVVVEAFDVEIPHRGLVAGSAGLAGLRLEPADGSAAVSAHLGQDGIEFRIETIVLPHPLGPDGFEGRVLEYELRGLGVLGDLRSVVLDGLRVRVRNSPLDAPVPDSHVQLVASIEDPRFSIGREPGAAAFLAGLPAVIESATEAPALESEAGDRVFRWRAGRYRLLEDFVPPADYTLVLEAGVEIDVSPGRSILVRGPLRVEGTRQHPVRIRAASPDSPWGVFAVQGRGRSSLDSDRPSADIQYLELSGGSEDYLRGVFYSGQLSIYHVDVRLAHVTLQGAIADDALNVKYAAVEIIDSAFADNAADAVDLDWVEGIVRASSFQRSGVGGDGIDVSGSDVIVEDSVFGDIGDKCVSVGEDSRLVLRGSLLRGCTTGVASKDLSQVDVRESVFLDNGRHLSAFEKKPIFGSARIHAADLLVGPSEYADGHDAGSVVTVERVSPLPAADLATLRTATDFSRDAYALLVERKR